MILSDLLAPADVLRLPAGGKSRVLGAMAWHAARSLALDADGLLRTLMDREALGSTGVGHGVALPHARLGSVPAPFGVFAALERPVQFGAVDDRPVDLVFLTLLPASVPELQLRALACVARRFKEPGMQEKLRGTADPAELYALLASI